MNDDFLETGALAKTIRGFKPRKSQQKMADSVNNAILDRENLIVEAETGTGKTFAYLIPILHSKKKAIISTGSKTLQDQLITKDIPIVSKAIKYSGKIALLKGRSNYLCLERFSQYFQFGADLSLQEKTDLAQIRHWLSQTKDGDVSKCTFVAEESSIWPQITSTNDNCLGSDCPDYSECFVVKARKKAMNADVIIVNHHLYFADAKVKNTGFAELIPETEITIFDEAHQLPEIASQYFGIQISSRQLFDLSKQITLLYRTEMKDLAQLQKCADQLQKSVQDLRLNLNVSSFRLNLRECISNQKIKDSLNFLCDSLEFCKEVLGLIEIRSALVKSCLERIFEYENLLEKTTKMDEKGWSFWFECSNFYFILGATPLAISEQFQKLMQARKQQSWIFTSATLSINQNLNYFSEKIGVTNAKMLQLESPFDYKTQALLCVPRFLPEQNDPQNAQKLGKTLQKLIEKNQGRCFFLCTSIRIMKELTAFFKQNLTLPVLMQGENSKTKLLEEFTQKGNAILVATNSFWEGVDVRGNVLSCVIIDKLPFSSPEDPLTKARIEDLNLQGKDPFLALQIPEAVIALKQGIGRLIRDFDDRGVIIICDHRLVSREYGSIFLKSLPKLPRTRSLEKAIDFLMNEKNDEK